MKEARAIIVGLNATLIALTVAATGSRVWRRVFVVRKFELQDGAFGYQCTIRPKTLINYVGLITLACVRNISLWLPLHLLTRPQVAATIFSTCQIVASGYGLGQHMVDMNMTQWPTLIKVRNTTPHNALIVPTDPHPQILMASNTFYFLCNWAVKHALLLFYADLTTSTSHLRLIHAMHFIAFGFGLSSILVDLFQCRPIRKNWDRGADGWCADKNAFFYANAVIMLATDCVLYAMPFVFTRGLRLRGKQRWGLRCLFGLGGL